MANQVIIRTTSCENKELIDKAIVGFLKILSTKSPQVEPNIPVTREILAANIIRILTIQNNQIQSLTRKIIGRIQLLPFGDLALKNVGTQFVKSGYFNFLFFVFWDEVFAFYYKKAIFPQKQKPSGIFKHPVREHLAPKVKDDLREIDYIPLLRGWIKVLLHYLLAIGYFLYYYLYRYVYVRLRDLLNELHYFFYYLYHFETQYFFQPLCLIVYAGNVAIISILLQKLIEFLRKYAASKKRYRRFKDLELKKLNDPNWALRLYERLQKFLLARKGLLQVGSICLFLLHSLRFLTRLLIKLDMYPYIRYFAGLSELGMFTPTNKSIISLFFYSLQSNPHAKHLTYKLWTEIFVTTQLKLLLVGPISINMKLLLSSFKQLAVLASKETTWAEKMIAQGLSVGERRSIAILAFCYIYIAGFKSFYSSK